MWFPAQDGLHPYGSFVRKSEKCKKRERERERERGRERERERKKYTMFCHESCSHTKNTPPPFFFPVNFVYRKNSAKGYNCTLKGFSHRSPWNAAPSVAICYDALSNGVKPQKTSSSCFRGCLSSFSLPLLARIIGLLLLPRVPRPVLILPSVMIGMTRKFRC